MVAVASVDVDVVVVVGVVVVVVAVAVVVVVVVVVVIVVVVVVVVDDDAILCFVPDNDDLKNCLSNIKCTLKIDKMKMLKMIMLMPPAAHTAAFFHQSTAS